MLKITVKTETTIATVTVSRRPRNASATACPECDITGMHLSRCSRRGK